MSTTTVTFLGNPLHLCGTPLKKGDKAPNFTVLGNDLAPKTLEEYKGKVVLISVVPSLDTGVCDTQTRRFNQEASALGENVAILTVSCDLPFAQKRWCGAAGVDRVATLSDHKDLSFGKAYGVAINELRLLTRSIFVVDKNGIIVHAEVVPEVTHEVNFDAALAAAKAAL